MKNELHMLHSVTDTICSSFLITTEDGRLIAVDGGYAGETDHFLTCLRALTGAEVPHIDLWILTHPHDDHVSVFLELMAHRPEALTVGRVCLNFPSKECLAAEDESAAGTMEDFYRVLPRAADKVRVVCGGDELRVGAARLRFLYSQDFAIRHNRCNNSSLVFRLDLGGRSVLFTGDCGEEAGEKILRLWGGSGILRCAICQMAHHGQNGCGRAFYEAVAPKICLWPTPSWLWTNDGGRGPYRTLETRGWMEALDVTEHYVSKDGTHVLTL